MFLPEPRSPRSTYIGSGRSDALRSRSALFRAGLHHLCDRVEVAFEAFPVRRVDIACLVQRHQMIHVEQVCA
jgi:hypothetical protein